jgi:large subunit ribosomal protein L17
MRKMVFGRHFSRGRKGREALIRSLLKALVINGKIVTTKAKAKGVQKDAEKIARLSASDTISARRKVSAILGGDRKLVETVFNKIGKALSGKKGGCTRIILLPRRRGDSAEMAKIEWSEKYVEEAKKITKKSKVKSVKKAVKKTAKKTKLETKSKK